MNSEIILYSSVFTCKSEAEIVGEADHYVAVESLGLSSVFCVTDCFFVCFFAVCKMLNFVKSNRLENISDYLNVYTLHEKSK